MSKIIWKLCVWGNICFFFLIIGLHALGRQKDNRHSTRGLSTDSNSENLQISSSAQGKPEKVFLQMSVLFLEWFCNFFSPDFCCHYCFPDLDFSKLDLLWRKWLFMGTGKKLPDAGSLLNPVMGRADRVTYWLTKLFDFSALQMFIKACAGCFSHFL